MSEPYLFLVAQLGARMHYSVPRILQNAGQLAHLYTDICSSTGPLRALSLLPQSLRTGPVRKILGRSPEGIPQAKISSFDWFGVRYARRLRKARTAAERTAVNLWANQEFCRRVLNRGFGSARAVYTFNGAGLPLLAAARRAGFRSVMEQTIAPLRFERLLMSEEAEAHPEWGEGTTNEAVFDRLCETEEAEWSQADLILCGSHFVKNAIGQCGGPVERCEVVPYGVELARYQGLIRERRYQDPLRVLTVGSVGLRKGTPYVLEAAKLMGPRAQFRAVGPIDLRPDVWRDISSHVQVLGSVPRSDMPKHYAWADVFLLPSLCEGSATATYEALAAGLPVICTDNTGSVVSDGEDGFVVPIRDANSICDRLTWFSDAPERLVEFSFNATRKCAVVSEAAYASRLLNALNKRTAD